MRGKSVCWLPAVPSAMLSGSGGKGRICLWRSYGVLPAWMSCWMRLFVKLLSRGRAEALFQIAATRRGAARVMQRIMGLCCRTFSDTCCASPYRLRRGAGVSDDVLEKHHARVMCG